MRYLLERVRPFRGLRRCPRTQKPTAGPDSQVGYQASDYNTVAESKAIHHAAYGTLVLVDVDQSMLLSGSCADLFESATPAGFRVRMKTPQLAAAFTS